MPIAHTLEGNVEKIYSKIKPGQREPLFNFHWSSGWSWFAYISMGLIGLGLLTFFFKPIFKYNAVNNNVLK